MLTFFKKLPVEARVPCVVAGSFSLASYGVFFATVVADGPQVDVFRLAFLVAATMGCAGLALSVIRLQLVALSAAAFLGFAMPIWATHFTHVSMMEFTIAIAICNTAIGAATVLCPRPTPPARNESESESEAAPAISPADRYPRLRGS